MLRVSAIVIAFCMVLISASFGAVLHLGLGVPGTGALVGAIAALTGFGLCTIAARAWNRPLADATTPAGDSGVSRALNDAIRQITELGRRVMAMETKVADSIDWTRATTAPLSSEIGEISVLIRQLAESVTIHEGMLEKIVEPRSNRADALQSVPPIPVEAPRSPVRAAAAEQVQAPAAVPRRRERSLASVPDAPAAGPRPGQTGFRGLGHDAARSAVLAALEANRFEFHLQPILSLPQRKVRYYEALASLRTSDGELVAASEFTALADAAGLMPRIDNFMVLRGVQVVRRLMSKNRDVGLFCGLSAATLADNVAFPQFTEFMEENRTLAPALVFEIGQAAYRSLGPVEVDALGVLAECGFRFSLNRIADLKFEPRHLADRGFRFVKVPAALLLNRYGASAADIDAVDLSNLLARFGVDLIAEDIEAESTVLELLDYDVKLAQGSLFSQPRPVRAELIQTSGEREAAPPAAEPMRPPPAPVERLRPLRTPDPQAGRAAAAKAAAATGSLVAPGAAPAAPRLEALQRPTAIAQIARNLVARVPQALEDDAPPAEARGKGAA